jgi:hypothetical protein
MCISVDTVTSVSIEFWNVLYNANYSYTYTRY